MNRKIQSKSRYLLSFLIGTFIFIFIFIISQSLSYLELQRISGSQGDFAYKIFEDKLDVSLFGKDICNESVSEKINIDLRTQGQIINDLEKKFGKENKEVLFRKNFYSLVEVEHLEFIKEMNDLCNFNKNIILFFYSNQKENLDKSEDMGRLLDILYNKDKNLVIYSFDSDLDSELIKKMKEKFEIEQPIVVLINEKCRIENLTALKDFERCLN